MPVICWERVWEPFFVDLKPQPLLMVPFVAQMELGLGLGLNYLTSL